MDKKDILKVNKIIFDYILKLDEDSMEALLYGNKKLILVEKNGQENKSIDDNNIDAINISLNLVKSREDAREFIENGRFNVKILKELAKVNNIYIRSKCNKAEIIDKIIEGTIGTRLKMQILKGE